MPMIYMVACILFLLPLHWYDLLFGQGTPRNMSSLCRSFGIDMCNSQFTWTALSLLLLMLSSYLSCDLARWDFWLCRISLTDYVYLFSQVLSISGINLKPWTLNVLSDLVFFSFYNLDNVHNFGSNGPKSAHRAPNEPVISASHGRNIVTSIWRVRKVASGKRV